MNQDMVKTSNLGPRYSKLNSPKLENSTCNFPEYVRERKSILKANWTNQKQLDQETNKDPNNSNKSKLQFSNLHSNNKNNNKSKLQMPNSTAVVTANPTSEL